MLLLLTTLRLLFSKLKRPRFSFSFIEIRFALAFLVRQQLNASEFIVDKADISSIFLERITTERVLQIDIDNF